MIGALPAAAQDQTSDHPFAALNCVGLSDADCAIVQGALENTATIKSFNQSFIFSFSISNASQIVKGVDTSVSAQGSGTVAVDHAKMADEPYEAFSMSMDASGKSTDSNGEQSGDASFVIVDGNLYLKNSRTGEWRGAALDDLAQHPEAITFSFMGMPVSQMMQMGAGMSMMGGDGTPTVFGLDSMKLLETPGFLSQERLPDDTIDGQTMAVFAYTADIGALLSNPDVQEAFAAMSDTGADAGSDNAMAQQMALMLPVLLQSTTGTVKLTRWIGADDGLPYRVTVDASAAVDLGIKSGTGTPVPPIEVNLDFAIDLSDINSAAAPTAPADAKIVPAEEFMTFE
jgi:hypothetical protein